MRFSVLKAGTASRATRARVGDFDAMFIRLLSQPGQQWEVHDVEHGEFPQSPRDYHGFVITGSAASAYDDEPWIRDLLSFVGEAYHEGVPLLGICFGLQVVTQALGGEVGPNPQGWDLGLAELTLTGRALAFAPLAGAPSPIRILETHQDVATRLPNGAVPLAYSHRTRHELFTLGERVLCLQGHPEMDDETVRELIEKRLQRGLLDPARAAEGLASLGPAPHRRFLQTWLRKYLRDGRFPVAA